MNRRSFLEQAAGAAGVAWLSNRAAAATGGNPVPKATVEIDPALAKDWLARWERNILSDARNRYCDRETGEEIGWLISPFLNGFYHGYQATRDAKWVAQLAAWADAWIKRGVKEPDGFNNAKFQRIDGGAPDARWANSPGVLWTALVPHDETLQRIFIANHDPAGWGGLAATPWFLAQQATGGSTKP